MGVLRYMKLKLSVSLLFFIVGLCGILLAMKVNPLFAKSSKRKKCTQTVYDFSFTNINGSPMPLSAYKGKVLLIVNTASKCLFASQYNELEELYQRYKKDGLVVIGVPSNDFGKQEKGSSEEIVCFLDNNYPVTFSITKKEIVKGRHAHPFYKWTGKKGWMSKPLWNFHKYLIGKDGCYIDYFASTTSPLSRSVVGAIEHALSCS